MIIFDTEISTKTKKIIDIGAITSKGSKYHDTSVDNFIQFIKLNKARFFVGHNIVNFDLIYLNKTKVSKFININNTIDTLYLSALLFPNNPSHKLVKDDKLNTDSINNPLNDSINAYNLFNDCVNKFNSLNIDLKDIYYNLLSKINGLRGFFSYLNYKPENTNVSKLIQKVFNSKICENKNINALISKYPMEVAFSLSYINSNENSNHLVPPWILNTHSKVEDILSFLRSTPCNNDCSYCNTNLSAIGGLQKYSKYSTFREFNGVKLQENAVKAALNNKSLLAIFPTGGGKSFTFQLPALMAGDNIGGLTVVISPLQALMKDQVDNLTAQGITNAAFLNGLQNPMERKLMMDKVSDGSVTILYIAPESLRSKTIEGLLMKRQIVRFVIDEAHCFSTWGHDFRVDYLYIGDFINKIKEKKALTNPIPISCFTATAKKDVVEDIKEYFKNKLDLDLEEFKTTKGRTNLRYQVKKVTDDQDRYSTLRDLLMENTSPTIIYCSRTKTIEELYKRLNNDNFKASKFHGKLENNEKIKNQEDFMEHRSNIMIATNAFGMGIDKDDVEVVIHFNISDSLENYVQEAGRAGRNEEASAKCYILYNEDDLQMHFDLLNHSKLSQKEIGQVWKGIKDSTKTYKTINKTALELATISGWDENTDVETKVKSSLLALEDANLIERGMNSPKVFASSLLVKNMTDAKKLINSSALYHDEDKDTAYRIVSSLISSKYKSWIDEEAENRIDYIASNLGLTKEVVIKHINLFKEIKLLTNDTDLYAKINKDTIVSTINTNLNRFKEYFDYINISINDDKIEYNIKQLNEDFNGNYKPNMKYLMLTINYLERMNVFTKNKKSRDYFSIKKNKSSEEFKEYYDEYFILANYIIQYLFNKYNNKIEVINDNYVAFSSVEIKEAYLNSLGMLSDDTNFNIIEDVILMLQILGIMDFEGGFFVIYNQMHITRIEQNNFIKYTKDDYKKLSNHYRVKNQQIHIVGKYAEKMYSDAKEAEEYVSDYFNLDYKDFLNFYFPGKLAKDLDFKMSAKRAQSLFGDLSVQQKSVIDDDLSPVIGVAAGPGSGKTKLLVHKLASIIYNEDVKTEQLLMLTFSRNAAIEFKERLKELIGNTSYYIDITTFHSYAFDLLGRPGNHERLENVLLEAIELIKSGEVDKSKITKTMLVIDEAQDMSKEEFELVELLIQNNEDIRVVAVGDDDQNIYEFRGSDSKYLLEMSKKMGYELTTNYRSDKLIVNFANKLISLNDNRLKINEIVSNSSNDGIVSVINHVSNNMIEPLINDYIRQNRNGTTAIITTRNEESYLLSAILNNLKIPNQVIVDSKEIKPINYVEVRYFYDTLVKINDNKIDLSKWSTVFDLLIKKYKDSKNLEKIKVLLEKFINNYTNPYISDLRDYLIQTDFYFDTDKILISTVHKSKGREFDNVYFLYSDYGNKLDEKEVRKLYVAVTRAKSYLSIHTNNNIFRELDVLNVEYFTDETIYDEPIYLDILYDHSLVFLGYYKDKQKRLNNLIVGDKLEIDNNTLIHNNVKVGRLSKNGVFVLEARLLKGFEVTDVVIENMVYWLDKEESKEYLIVLPRISFKKITSS